MFCFGTFVFVTMIFGVACQEDCYELKTMVEKLTERNEQLEIQLKSLTDGLADESMPVHLGKCDCKDSNKTGTNNLIETLNEDLKLLSIAWQGEMDDSVNLTFKMEASSGYVIEWLQIFNRGNGIVVSPGKVSTTTLVNGRYLYTSEIHFRDFNFTRHIMVRAYSLKKTATVGLNLTALRESGEYKFKEMKYKITKYNPVELLPHDITEEYNITINVTKNILEIENRRLDYFYTFMNSTTHGKTIKEVFDRKYIPLNLNDYGIGDIEVNITLKPDLLGNGGLLSLFLTQTENEFLDELWYGVVIQLLKRGHESVAPKESVAVHNLYKNIYVASSSVSVFCFVMGNPVPEIKISKVEKSGTKELKTEIIVHDKYTFLRSVTIQDSNTGRNAILGTYFCEASNGFEKVITKTIVHRYKPVRFDDCKTGIIVNTTKKVVVSCKASGNPRPNLEIRLGDSYGPDLLKSEGNFTSKISSRRKTSKAVIKFSPVDDRFDVVFCVAVQTEHQMDEMFEKEVRIFRDKTETDLLYNKYTFYESFRQPN